VTGLLLAAVVTAVGSPSQRGELIWDDHHQIVQSEAIRSLANLPTFFDRTVREGVRAAYHDAAAPEGLKLYRPVFVSLLAVEYALAGGAEPVAFHLFALLLHVVVVLLLWRLAARWTGSEHGAVVAALLLAFHPVTAEAWLFVSAQCELVAAAALLGATLLVEGRSDARAKGWARAAASAVVLLMGLLAKETIAMALPAVCLYLWLARGIRLTRLAPWLAAALVFLVLRTAVLSGGDGGEGAWGAALAHLPLVLGDGLRALVTFTPVGYRELALEYVHLDGGVAIVAAAGVVAVGVAAVVARRAAPTATVAVGVYLLMVAPVALVSTVPSWGGFGRYLYVPWAFAALALVHVVLVVGTGPRWAGVRRVGLPLAVLGVLALQLLGLRNAMTAYRSTDEMMDAAIVAAPGAATGYVGKGNACLTGERFECAADHYEAAHARNPELHYVSQNRAIALLGAGRPQEALDVALDLEGAQGRGPRSSFAVASALWALGREDEARERLDWAAQRAPDDEDLRWLLSTLAEESPP